MWLELFMLLAVAASAATEYPACTDQVCVFDGRLAGAKERCEIHCGKQPECRLLERGDQPSNLARRCVDVQVMYIGHGHNHEYLKKNLTDWTAHYKGGEVKMERRACEEARLEDHEMWRSFLAGLPGQGTLTCQQSVLFNLDDCTPVTFSFKEGQCSVKYAPCDTILRCIPSELNKSIKCLKEGKPVKQVCCFQNGAQLGYQDGSSCPRAPLRCDAEKGELGILKTPCVGSQAYRKLPYSMDCGKMPGLCCQDKKGQKHAVCCKDGLGYEANPDLFYIKGSEAGSLHVVQGEKDACKPFVVPECRLELTADATKPNGWQAEMNVEPDFFGEGFTPDKWKTEITKAYLVVPQIAESGGVFDLDPKAAQPFTQRFEAQPTEERDFVLGKVTVCYSLLQGSYRRCVDSLYCSARFPKPVDEPAGGKGH